MSHNRFQSVFEKPWGRSPEKRPKRQWGGILWTALKRTAMVMGFMVLLSALLSSLLIAVSMKDGKPSIGDQVVLYLPMQEGWNEHKEQSGLSYDLAGPKLTVRQIIDALDRGAKDDRVKGVVASYQGGIYNLAHLYEVRNAVERFKKSGKFAYIYGNELGGAGTGGIGTYYFASIFDEIWLQPMGTVFMTGINAEMPFLRGMLDKLGVEPQFFARKEYKSVFESIARYESSAYNTEMMTAIVSNIALFVVDAISKARGKTLPEMNALVNQGLFLDTEAKDAGLVTHLDYIDKLFTKMRTDITGDPESEDVDFVGVGYYSNAMKSEHHLPAISKKNKVALIYTVGTIMPNKEMAGGRLSSAQDVSAAIMQAAEDDDVKIIVLRIDSPGGSPTASETIRRTLIRAQEKGKKVIVSMGGTAASGGYWIAAPADYIFATPGTLTGSIGVAGGKVVLAELWEKIGVNWDGVQFGENADLMSFNERFDERGEERFNALMDNIYSGFIERVAEGRDMDIENVDEIARGRVWTGAMARDIGLVDEIGGLDNALDFAAAEIGAKDRQALDVLVLPRPKTTFELLAELLAQQVKMGDFLSTHAATFDGLTPVLESLKVQSSGGPMIYEPARIR